MKDIIIFILVITLILNTIFIWCCMIIAGEDDRRSNERIDQILRERKPKEISRDIFNNRPNIKD